MVMEKINQCNICGGVIKNIYKLKNKDIVGMAEEYVQEISMCPNCGFIFTQNPFGSEQLNNRYKNYSKFEYDSQKYILDEAEGYKINSKKQKEFITRCIGMDNVKSVLEIGAASGYNLSLYKENAQVYGIEPSEINCFNAKEKYGVSMYCGFFDEFERGMGAITQKWDLIFLSHTLEHIVNPCDFVAKCSEINSKYFFIEVPTFDFKLSNEPFGMFCEEHVNMFTLEGLQSLMNKCGYQLKEAEMSIGINSKLPAGSPSILTIWEKPFLKKYDFVNDSLDILNRYIADSERIMNRIWNVIYGIDDKKRLAVWGTGHHVSMLLANTNLAKKNIVKVYDSDERKHGLRLNGCQIQAFSSKDIKDREIDAILLATYTAQEALEKILEPYKGAVEIIKLY